MQDRKSVDSGMIWGGLLVAAGLFFLLQTLGIVQFPWRVMTGLGLLFGGAVFLAVFAQDRRQWWALFPAFALGLSGVTVGLESLLPAAGSLAGPLFLGGLGLAFGLVYRTSQQNWWAIIPAGVLFTLALVAGLDTLLPWFDFGWLFFGGLSLTFGFLWWETGKQQQWALIVALACGGLAALILVGSLMRFFLPLALVAAGVVLLVRQQRSGGPR